MRLYSPTQIATFENCPQRYKYRYIDRIGTEEENIEAFMGKRVHEVLEKLHKDIILHKENSLKELLSFYKKRWDKKWHKGVRIVKDNNFTKENYFKTGEQCIENYYRRYHPFNQGRTIGLELKVKIPLSTNSELPYSMIGIIDRLAYLDNGVYEIHDYKTSTTLPDMAKLDQDIQLPLYQLAVEEMWRDSKEIKLVWHYLVFDKEIVASRSREDLKILKEEVKGLIKRIENERDFHPAENPLCKWCEYRSICSVWKHLYKIEELTTEEYSAEDGVRMVNQYAAIRKEMKELEERLHILQDALLDYSRREGIEVIYGVNYKIHVSKTKVWRFPTKSREPERRKELEYWLQKIGRWNEVSSLNTFVLEKVLKEKRWREKFLNKLKEFASMDERVSFYLSKINEEE